VITLPKPLLQELFGLGYRRSAKSDMGKPEVFSQLTNVIRQFR